MGGLYHIGIRKDRNKVAYKYNDLIALTLKGSRGVEAQPPLFNNQNVRIKVFHG